MSTSSADSGNPLHAELGKQPGPHSGTWPMLRRVLPKATVVVGMVALAAWGYQTEWRIPKFSDLFGGSAVTGEEWCNDHGVPEAECIECHPELAPLPQDFGWCKTHGVAQCPLEHPEVAQLRALPTITEEDLQRAQRALDLRPRAENNSLCKLYHRRVQFASMEALRKAGVDVAVVTERPITESILANGEVTYDETHMAHLASRVAGSAWRVEKQVGAHVKRGELLALIDAADVGKAKADFLQALAQVRLKRAILERLQPLAGDGSVPGRQYREAEVALEETQIRLRSAQQLLVNMGMPVRAEDFDDLGTEVIADRIQFLGLPPKVVASFDSESTTSNLFPLRSSLDGVIVATDIVTGEVVNTATTLFTVADLSQMWLILNVRQDDAKYLSLGQKVLFRPSDSRNETEIAGTLAWLSTEADNQTRTVKVRVDLPNTDGHLRANTFGSGRILLRQEPRAVVVPTEAIHSDGDCSVVFVRDKNFLREGSPKFFHVRTVRLGVREGDTTEIIAGLLPGEVIASKNSVVLEAQLLKGGLGAGCGCADGH